MAVFVIVSALLMRLILGTFVTNTYDVYWYRQWILDFQNGFFDIYSRADAIALDYPPLFLVLVYPVSLLYRLIPADSYYMADMLFMKLIPILFDAASAALLFYICRHNGHELTGLFITALWLCDPSILFNSTIWGQTDSCMAFLLILSFWLLHRRRRVIATVIFSAACMIKFQCLFFAPVFFLGLMDACDVCGEGLESAHLLPGLKKLLLSIGTAVLTIAVVFTPFVIGAKNPGLIFDVYLGSAGKYPYCTLNAFNFYGILGLNWVKSSQIMFGSVTYGTFGIFMTVSGALAVMCLWFFGQKRCVFLAGVFLMQHIFMFMTSMHERYQIIVLPFVLLAYITHRNRRYLYMYMALSAVTAINQFTVLSNATKGVPLPWDSWFAALMAAVSVINLAIYIWSAAECVIYFTKRKKQQQHAAVSEV